MNRINPDDLAKWEEAGKLTAQVRSYARSIITEGMSILLFSEQVETKIKELGGTLAFPINISFNETAAHDAAAPGDTRVFGKDVVKIDIGAARDGYVGDTAFTVDFTGEYEDLITATRDALNAAITIAKAGTTLGEIGRVIQETIKAKGYSPVVNLSGHGIARYEIHTSPSIPNYSTGSNVQLEEHMIIAIEPFATTGTGKIEEKGRPLIFSQIAGKNVRSPYGRKILQQIQHFQGLPFSLRNLSGSDGAIALGIRELVQQGILREHPPLVEVAKGIVAQSEHSLYIKKEGNIVLTQ